MWKYTVRYKIVEGRRWKQYRKRRQNWHWARWRHWCWVAWRNNRFWEASRELLIFKTTEELAEDYRNRSAYPLFRISKLVGLKYNEWRVNCFVPSRRV